MNTNAQEKNMHLWIPWVLLCIVLGAFASLQTWHFEEAFVFHGDHERDLRMALGLVQHGEWPAVTPTISPFPIQLGPLLYLILAPIVAISADPFFVKNAFLLFTMGSCLLFFISLRRSIRWEAALFCIGALVASVFTFEMSRQLWHSSLLPLPIAVFYGAAHRILNEQSNLRRNIIYAGISAAIAVQLHAVGSIFGLLWLSLLWTRRNDLKKKDVLLSVSAIALTALPFLWTLIETIQVTGAGPSDSMPSTWQPASLWTVGAFFLENIKPIWGDNIGPWMIWPWSLLLLWGAISAVQKRNRFAIFLVANVCLGWVVESLLLGNQLSHRYMHANLWSSFGLIGFGLHDLMNRWSPRVIGIAAATTLGVITVEAWFSPVPHAGVDGWLNAREQREVAQTVATNFPLTDTDMETRVHGVYFGELTGIGHFHSLYQSTDVSNFSDQSHVMVMPSDVGLVPHGRLIEPATLLAGPHRTIAVYAFEPFIDWQHMTIQGSTKAELFQKWRRLTPQWYGKSSNRGPTGAPLEPSEAPQHGRENTDPNAERGTTHQIQVPVMQPGVLHLVLQTPRDARDRCPLSITLDGQPQKIVLLENVLSRMEIHRIALKKSGRLHLQLGPCRDLKFFDLW